MVINIGTNDQNPHNNISAQTYQENLTRLIQGVHGVWPKAQVVLMVSYHAPSQPERARRNIQPGMTTYIPQPR